MFVKGDNREFGDLGRFRVGNVFRPVTSVVSAVAKPVAAISKPVSSLVTSIAKPIVRPIASVARPVFNPVNSVINRVTGGSPILKLGVAAVVPGTTLAVASSLRRDYSEMRAARGSRQESGSPFESSSQPSEGPMVTVYGPNGEQGQISSSYLRNGKYDDGSQVWSTEPKKNNAYDDAEMERRTIEAEMKRPRKQDQNDNENQGYSQQQDNRGGERFQTDTEEGRSNENATTEQFTAPMPTGKKVTVYAEDGSEGEIDSSLLRKGEYTENGMVWRTAPKEGSMGKQSKTVTVYAPDGTVGDVRADLVKNGRYIEDGVVWTTSPQMDKSGMTFWQKIVAAIGEGNARAGLSGFGDVSMAPGTDLSQIWNQGQSSGVASMFDRLSNTVSRVQSTATAGRKLAQAIRGKKPTPGVPANAGGGLPEKTDTIMGLPPAVVYGAGAVVLAGGAYIVVKKIRKRK